jgi:Sec63 Brl domain
MAHLCSSLNIFATDDPNLIKKRFDYKTDLQLLNILSNCKEFESISPRLEEMEELKTLTRYWLLD